MRSSEQHVRRPPARWWQAVCVLGLLAGLLAMHGLAPGGGLPEHTDWHPHASSASSLLSAPPPAPSASSAPTASLALSAPPASMAVDMAHVECSQNDGSCGGGHLQHADAVCASGAVSDGAELPVPVPDPVPVVVGDGIVRAYAADAPDGARAPPSLAELQLLRI